MQTENFLVSLSEWLSNIIFFLFHLEGIENIDLETHSQKSKIAFELCVCASLHMDERIFFKSKLTFTKRI